MGTVIQENLSALRDVFGITQRELGDLAGVSSQAVSAWEKGRNLPDVLQLEKVADSLGFSAGLFMTRDGIRNGIDQETRLQRSDSIKAGVRPRAYTAPLYDAISASDQVGEAAMMGEVPVPQQVFEAHPSGFFLRMPDQRMNKKLPEGSCAFIDPEATVQNGDLAAIIVGEDDARIGRFHELSNSVALQPESTDPSFRDELFDKSDVTVVGRVVWFGSPYGERL